jgi:hypothetical protein
LYVVETWTFRKVDQKSLKSFEIWGWRRMEKISWTNRVRNEEVLHRVMEERNILQMLKEGRLTEMLISCVGTVVPYCTNQSNQRMYSFLFPPTDCICTQHPDKPALPRKLDTP